MSSFKKQIPEFKKSINDHLKIILSESDQSSEELSQAMKYSVMNGGKRIRPMMMLASAVAIDIDTQHVIPFATAIELLTHFSLIHDDLPCMDDDSLRRVSRQHILNLGKQLQHWLLIHFNHWHLN